ncbi:Phosphoribosyltransferase C-terminal protein [Raphanus sativus]|nr:Phosphoribosyltransferase C-terminal protein [Raphanus sativus]
METNSNKPPSFLPKRSQSVDRRRPSPSPATEMSAATKMLITSTRSLSLSFQGEAFSLPSSKKKEATAAPHVVALLVVINVLRHPRFRYRLPSVPLNFFRRLPAKTECML